MSAQREVHVAVGAITNPSGDILIALRPDHVHQGGLWEFPGGKVEPGETVREALRRELWEELGIEITSARPLIRIPYHYPDKHVFLDVWMVNAFNGEPAGQQGQPLRWVPRRDLLKYTFPAANYPIVTALRLPECYLITPDPADYARAAFLAQFEQALQDARLSVIQLRSKCLDRAEYESVARDCVALARQYQKQLLVNGDFALALAAGADGVHLSSQELHSLNALPQRHAHFWAAASCHHLTDLQKAAQLKVDFSVLGSVKVTPSHPSQSPLGWRQFAAWAHAAQCPVYALGGMEWDDLETAWLAGGQGIAGIRAFWPTA